MTFAQKLATVEDLVANNPTATGSLVGVDGNAYSLMGYTDGRLRQAGWDRADIEKVMEIAMSDNYWRLIAILNACLVDEDE